MITISACYNPIQLLEVKNYILRNFKFMFAHLILL